MADLKLLARILEKALLDSQAFDQRLRLFRSAYWGMAREGELPSTPEWRAVTNLAVDLDDYEVEGTPVSSKTINRAEARRRVETVVAIVAQSDA